MSNIRRMLMSNVVPKDALLDIDGNPIKTTLPNGYTLYWRQLLDTVWSIESKNGISITKNGDCSYKLNGVVSVNGYIMQVNCTNESTYPQNCPYYNIGHRYVSILETDTTGSLTTFRIALSNDGGTVVNMLNAGTYYINNSSYAKRISTFVYGYKDCNIDDVNFRAVIYDITNMFRDCPDVMPTNTSDFGNVFTGLGYTIYTDNEIKCIIKNGYLIKQLA